MALFVSPCGLPGIRYGLTPRTSTTTGRSPNGLRAARSWARSVRVARRSAWRVRRYAGVQPLPQVDLAERDRARPDPRGRCSRPRPRTSDRMPWRPARRRRPRTRGSGARRGEPVVGRRVGPHVLVLVHGLDQHEPGDLARVAPRVGSTLPPPNDLPTSTYGGPTAAALSMACRSSTALGDVGRARRRVAEAVAGAVVHARPRLASRPRAGPATRPSPARPRAIRTPRSASRCRCRTGSACGRRRRRARCAHGELGARRGRRGRRRRAAPGPQARILFMRCRLGGQFVRSTCPAPRRRAGTAR